MKETNHERRKKHLSPKGIHLSEKKSKRVEGLITEMDKLLITRNLHAPLYVSTSKRYLVNLEARKPFVFSTWQAISDEDLAAHICVQNACPVHNSVNFTVLI